MYSLQCDLLVEGFFDRIWDLLHKEVVRDCLCDNSLSDLLDVALLSCLWYHSMSSVNQLAVCKRKKALLALRTEIERHCLVQNTSPLLERNLVWPIKCPYNYRYIDRLMFNFKFHITSYRPAKRNCKKITLKIIKEL